MKKSTERGQESGLALPAPDHSTAWLPDSHARLNLPVTHRPASWNPAPVLRVLTGAAWQVETWGDGGREVPRTVYRAERKEEETTLQASLKTQNRAFQEVHAPAG